MASGISLGIEGVVTQLRDLRNQSLQSRHRDGRPPRLPSRRILADIVAGLAAAMFPNRSTNDCALISTGPPPRSMKGPTV